MFLELAEESERIRQGASEIREIKSLFQPDTLLLFQYLDTLRSKSYREGEKRLMLAVLEDAISCYQKYYFARNKKGKELFHELEEWIMKEKGDRLFSFTSICESLEIAPDYLRRGLLRWKEREVSKCQLKRKGDARHGQGSGLWHGGG